MTTTPPRVLFGTLLTSLPPFPTEWLEKLTKAYTESIRKYHNISHIEALLGLFKGYHDRGEVKDPEAVELAIYFHDIVYDPAAPLPGDNELASIAVLKQFASETNLHPPELLIKATELIHATISHQLPLDPEDNSPLPTTISKSDMELFLDFDLSVLVREDGDERGGGEGSYNEYAAQIREEYAHLPDHVYRMGRISVLERFLDRGVLFFSGGFRERERVARGNLRREIERLGEWKI